jgi:hypothetical protein
MIALVLDKGCIMVYSPVVKDYVEMLKLNVRNKATVKGKFYTKVKEREDK